ncbi:Pentatricopeptide repeat superfamily protein [Perilla frutescens var. hirtella]|nr:Pentatricopeptide repeat superfamily protein [Perilla frutescens var. hirtella]
MYSVMAQRVQRLSLFVSSTPLTTRYLCSITNLQSQPSPSSKYDDVQRIFRIITTSPDPQSLKHSLRNSQITFSNDLIDRVLKRARFSHSNPLSALEFYKFTSRAKGFFHTPFSFDNMLYVLGRNRKFEEMWELLLETKKKDQSLITPRTVQVVLARIAKVCSVRQTVESFKRFKRLVLKFDVDCYNALFRTLSQEKSMSDARNVYHALKHEFRPNLHTFNILLAGWRSPEEAEAFFGEMRDMGVKPDLVSYNCLVDVCCKGRELQKAYALIDKMRDEGIDLDVITYTSLIGGLGLAGQPDKAREVLKEMREYGCYPDVAAYNAVIRNFCIAKRLGDAYSLMEEMVEKGLSPNATTFNVVLRSLYWANDLRSSWSLYLRMKEMGCLPNTQSCMFLIRLIRRQENADLALELWNDMIDKGFGAYTLVSDVLFDLLCDMGKLEEAERCFLQMLEKGQKPSQVSFRRIKVLMELAGKHDALANLSEKMSAFGSAIHTRKSYADELDTPISDIMI